MTNIIKIAATFFGVGYLPLCPGTWASAAAVGLYYTLRDTPLWCVIGVAAVLMMVGFLVCSRAERMFGKKDSSYIVIDEAATMFVLLVFVPHATMSIIAAFVLFRIFDIVKPYPIKKIEHFSGSWGIMIDDIVAGIYTAVFVWMVAVGMRR